MNESAAMSRWSPQARMNREKSSMSDGVGLNEPFQRLYTWFRVAVKRHEAKWRTLDGN